MLLQAAVVVTAVQVAAERPCVLALGGGAVLTGDVLVGPEEPAAR